jgi:mono/diheme cytochrome c family protein
VQRFAVALLAWHAAAVVTLAGVQAPVGNSSERTVWDGAFTIEQAERGKAQYAAACARCHGGSLEGGMGRSLAGAAFLDKWREQTVGDLLDYVSKNMPMGQTSTVTLSPPVYADLVAFLLHSNQLPAGAIELTAASAAGVLIVPKTGSTGELPATTLARVVGCLGPREADGSWRLLKASRPERMKSIETAGSNVSPAQGGDRQFALRFVLQSLAPMIGQRVAVVGILMGDGGADGINVSTVTPITATCD